MTGNGCCDLAITDNIWYVFFPLLKIRLGSEETFCFQLVDYVWCGIVFEHPSMSSHYQVWELVESLPQLGLPLH